MAQSRSRNTVVALCLAALVFAAASLPAATAYGCYDDCYERCANGKQDPACVKMCNEACGGAADAAAKAVGAVAAAGVGAAAAGVSAAASTLDSASDKSLDAAFQKADAAKAPAAGAYA